MTLLGWPIQSSGKEQALGWHSNLRKQHGVGQRRRCEGFSRYQTRGQVEFVEAAALFKLVTELEAHLAW